jgi:hypothetical protein
MNNEQKHGTDLVLEKHGYKHISSDGFEVLREAIHKQYARLQRLKGDIQGSIRHHSNADIGRQNAAHRVEGNQLSLTPVMSCTAAYG